MEEFYYQIYEITPSKDGTEERFVWQFENEESALGFVHFIECNDVNFPCLEIKKTNVKPLYMDE